MPIYLWFIMATFLIFGILELAMTGLFFQERTDL